MLFLPARKPRFCGFTGSEPPAHANCGDPILAIKSHRTDPFRAQASSVAINGKEGRILELASLQQRINQIQWYHDLDFPNGLKARAEDPDAEAHRKLWAWMRSELDKIDFAGKTVLDIGCWDGYWSFYAEQRGASRVLAIDDKTQNWGGGAGLGLAKQLMGSSIETRTDVSIYEIGKVKKRFDIVLCMGVYYHLLDPFLGFSQVRHRVHERSVIVFEGDFAPDGVVQPKQAAYLNVTDGYHCFMPTVTCLRQMLEANYFRVATESTYRRRILVTCAPFVGTNMLHMYQPPFGLHIYDRRFSPRLEAGSLRHNGRVALRSGDRTSARKNFINALRLEPFRFNAYKGLVKTFWP